MASASATNNDLSAEIARFCGVIVSDIIRVAVCDILLTVNVHCSNPDQPGNFCTGQLRIVACLMCVKSRVRATAKLFTEISMSDIGASGDAQFQKEVIAMSRDVGDRYRCGPCGTELVYEKPCPCDE